MKTITNSEELDTLLEKLGFRNLHDEIISAAAQGLPYFKITTDIKFGSEKMFFDLFFLTNHEHRTVSLDRIHATHLADIYIDGPKVNGVDPRLLDYELGKFSWKFYFNHPVKISIQEKEYCKNLLKDLWALSSNDSDMGRKMMNLLICKHFPREYWSQSANQFSIDSGSISQTIEISNFENWNTNYCFLKMSGRYAEVKASLIKLGLATTFNNLSTQLKQQVLNSKIGFLILEFSHNDAEGCSKVVIPVEMNHKQSTVHDYNIEYYPYPKIEHGIYNHIDTIALEEQMKQISVKDDKDLFIFSEDDTPELTPEMTLVSDRLYHLSQDPIGVGIADILELKYFQGITYLEDNIPETAWKLLERLPKRKVTFPSDIPVIKAINLTKGRSVFIDQKSILSGKQPQWMQFSFSESIGGNNTSEMYRKIRTVKFA